MEKMSLFFRYYIFMLLLSTCWCRYVSSESLENQDKPIIKCSCVIMADMMDDSPYHHFGVIQTYSVDGTENQCHHIRHNCRKECALRANLGVDVQLNKPLGKQLCEKLGIPTIRHGARLSSHATLDADVETPCIETASRYDRYLTVQTSKEVLCCGNTIVGSGQRRFGWNPDCQGRNFVLV